MSRPGNEPVERKPLPVPCEKCGAATNYDRRLCVYCEDKEPPTIDVKFGDVDLGKFRSKDVKIDGEVLGLVAAWMGSRPIVSNEPWRGRRRR